MALPVNSPLKPARSALTRLFAVLSRYGENILGRGRRSAAASSIEETFAELAAALLSVRGEASGMAIASDLLALFDACDEPEKQAIFATLASRFGPDPNALEKAWESYREQGPSALPRLSHAIEAPRQELFRRLNLAPGGTQALVRMRADLLASKDRETRAIVDADLVHILQSWFNRGFLSMRRLDWSAPAKLLENLIRFEAVHHIRDWADLRNRLDPPDRRCYAFFHPAIPTEPLIFVEVALTKGMASDVQAILDVTRSPIRAQNANTANFYSISNCQTGLRGISFGHFLIKEVALDLRSELPGVQRFCTLSPIPGFMTWLREDDPVLAGAALGESEDSAEGRQSLPLIGAAARYLVHAKNDAGFPRDPVARFHLGNGARLERLNWDADCSPQGLSQSAGMMVNYLYEMDEVEANHEAYVDQKSIRLSPEIGRLVTASGTSKAA